MANAIGQDVSGNSMTGTVVQAVLLAQFATSNVWVDLKLPDNPEEGVESEPAAGSTDRVATNPEHIEPSPDCDMPEPTEPAPDRSDRKRKRKASALESNEAEASNLEVAAIEAPVRRIRGKQKPPTSLLPARRAKGDKKRSEQKCRKGQGGKGNPNGEGKKKMCTIMEKEAICKAWDELKAQGVKRPTKALEAMKLKGYFAGCVFESKWGALRREQNWTLLCEAAPHLCKKHKELPNSLRSIMQLKEKSLPKKGENLVEHTIPGPLKQVIADMVLERIEKGEEVNMIFVKNAIVFGVDLWNECVRSVRGMLRDKSLDMLRDHDEEYAQMSNSELSEVFEKLSKDMSSMLVTLQICRSEGALRNSVCNTCKNLLQKNFQSVTYHMLKASWAHKCSVYSGTF